MSRRLGSDVDGLNPEALRALAELVGDGEALTEIVDAFLDEAPRRLAELRLAADQGDAALGLRAAHTLKSNGLTFGADGFAALCRRLEAAASEGALAGHRGLIDRLDEEWTHVRDELALVRGGGAG